MVEYLSTHQKVKSISMQVFRAKAFTSSKQIDSKDILGNPASVVFCNAHFPTVEEMRKIAISEKSPMTAFLVQKANTSDFQIQFFTPAGEQFGLCGHATLVAAYFIYQLFGYEKAFFYKNDILIIESQKQNGGYKISLPAYSSETISFNQATTYLNDLGIDQQYFQAAYFCKQINDVILVLNKVDALRAAHPNFQMLKEHLAEKNVRGIFITALSNLPNIDYEVRIFAPHLGINEDISCGSANCSILPLWAQLFTKKEDTEIYTILCPYNTESNKFGGLEEGTYLHEKDTILIGGRISD